MPLDTQSKLHEPYVKDGQIFIPGVKDVPSYGNKDIDTLLDDCNDAIENSPCTYEKLAPQELLESIKSFTNKL